LAIFGSIFGGEGYLFFLCLGLGVGVFTGKMLIDRTTRVFKKKNFLLAGIFVAVLLVSLIPVQGDWFGIVSYVPEAEDVEYVEVRGGNIYQDDLTEEEDIKLVCQIHSYAIENLDHENELFCSGSHRYFHIEYHLKNGRIVTRHYQICVYSPAGQLVNELPNKRIQ
jgi:hypothetical protein